MKKNRVESGGKDIPDLLLLGQQTRRADAVRN